MQAKVLILLALVAVALGDNLDGPKHVEDEKSASPNDSKPKHVDDSKKDKRDLLDLGIGYASPYTVVSGPSVVTTGVHTSTLITKELPVVVHHHVAAPTEKPKPVIQKVAVPVDRPFAVPVPVAKPVPAQESKPVAVPVPVPVHVPVVKHVVSAPYPIVKHVSASAPLTQTYVVEKHHAPLTGLTTYTVYN